MPRIEKDLIVKNKKGLHVRVASELVRVASQYAADVVIYKDGREINGKSIMSVLTLEATYDSAITLVIDGPDAEEAMPLLEKLLVGGEEDE
ncbi:MAG: HPr family phosphocarrier protein [Candidatus Omnitrophica bacterium]|nr:HPr family phosphocarrier protein [Candidatus Omnitrophota bacterium]